MCQAQQAPVQETKANTELPEWAKPYAKDALSKASALTDINQNPYQQYTQPRTAGFSPMQQNAMQAAQNMTVTPQTADATAGANMAGMGGLGIASQANPSGFQSQMGGYMNPYMNQILAPQMAEANRQYDIGATKQQGAATQAGAFGGSREAIMAAENERNRSTGLNQIYGQGMSNAYNQAQNQYNQNTSNQLQGLGLANQASANLGQLGQNQYGQQMGINQLQNQYGTAQQNLAQTGLNTAYQDFQNEKNYPYKQLGFMSDMVRGLPLGQQSTTQMYQGPPTALQTVGALGMGAYGLSKMASGGIADAYAAGGGVNSYAGDQGSVTSDGNIEAIINRLSPEQLQHAKQSALARRDMQTVETIDSRLAELASEKSMSSGIAGAVPQQMADGVVNAAGGGILAFADGGAKPKGNSLDSYLKKIEDLSNEDLSITPENRIAGAEALAPSVERRYGTSATAPFGEEIAAERAALNKNTSKAEGLGAFKGMQAMLQGNNFMRGLAGAGAAYSDEVMKAEKENREANRALRQSQITLAASDQARKDGLVGKADELLGKGQAEKLEARNTKIAAQEKMAGLTVQNVASERQLAGHLAAVHKPTFDLSMVEANVNAAIAADPSIAKDPVRMAALKKTAFENTAAIVKSGTAANIRAENLTAATYQHAVDAVAQRLRLPGPEKIMYKNLQELDKRGGTTKAEEYKASLVRNIMGAGQPAPQGGAPTPTPAPQSGAPGKPSRAVFMDAARKANPTVSDADLEAYYNTTYK